MIDEDFNLDDKKPILASSLPATTTPNKVGAPKSAISAEQEEAAFELIRTTKLSNEKVCLKVGIAYGSFKRIIQEDAEFRSRYLKAKEGQAEYLASEAIEIADEELPLYVDPRMWMALVKRQELRVKSRHW